MSSYQTWPDGTKSVKDNKAQAIFNTDYIETTMQVDHYFDEGASSDGHHKYVQSPKSESGGTPSDPSLATGQDGVSYFKEKTAVESPAQQDVQPYFRNAGQVMQLLGIRACGVFTVDGDNITVNYSHNLAVQDTPGGSTISSDGIYRASTGAYVVKFAAALPSDDYLILADTLASGGVAIKPEFISGAGNKQTTDFTMLTVTGIGTSTAIPTDPLQCWFVVFGG